MFTLILAYINAKYKAGYDGLFILTACFDFACIYAVLMIYSLL